MLDSDKIKELAIGKAYSILASLGIEVSDDPKKHGPCPICGPGNNNHRFRFDNQGGKGTWICSQCGSGDLWSLVMMSLGIGFRDALKRVADVLGESEPDTPSQEKKLDEGKIRAMLNELWKDSIPLNGSDQATQYLRSRYLVMQPEDVRFCPKCYESETKTFWPAMVALVRGINGKPITIHRTYLDGAAKKADILSPKKTMPCVGRLRQAAVRLFPPKDGLIGVAEGIETAIAATQLWGIPTWAALSTSVMESFMPPEGIRRVVVFADNDANFAGAKSAYTLANRLYLKDYIVSVEIPSLGDWADEAAYRAKHMTGGGV